MRVAILYNATAADATTAERDVLVQRDAVRAAVSTFASDVRSMPCSLDLATAGARLAEVDPTVVFNLVESLGGSDRLMSVVPALLDTLGHPYTGCGTEAIVLTTNKVLAKQQLRRAGLPTPAWLGSADGPTAVPGAQTVTSGMTYPCRVVIKTVWEHASYGLDDRSIVAVDDVEALTRQLVERERELGRPCFAEAFVDGREFNVSLVTTVAGAPDVLPVAEIDFSAFPPGKPRIVGTSAKWEPETFEYSHTPRCFEFAPDDAGLVAELAELSRRCWDLFGLRGYARVDFRVDTAGRPWILEVNANPCLSPDAGFAAAVDRAGLSYDTTIRQIVEGAVRRSDRQLKATPV